MSTIKRITAKQLRVGMYVAELNNEWIPDNNLRRHGLIKREEAVQQVLNLGVTHVYIDTSKGEDCVNGISREELDQQLNEELKKIQQSASSLASPNTQAIAHTNAKNIHVDALSLVSQVMDDVKMGNAIAIQDVEDMAASINESIRRNQNALSCFTRLRHKDEYLIEHSFSVAVLLGMLARSMGYSNDDLHQVVTGGLLHDIGKINVPDAILNKPGSLNSDEWEEMKRHVIYGEEILRQTDNLPSKILQICSQHHERFDGTGYPRGLSAGALSEHGKMGAVVDVYDAITADRVYHRGIPPTASMKKLLEWSDGHLDKAISYQFIACMSIYPAGSLVELEQRKIALVIEPNLRQQHKPLVKVIFDAKENKKVIPTMINLAHSESAQKIVRALDPADIAVDLSTYF
jgi:putative nucleotidyltransferase with HDIG domain